MSENVKIALIIAVTAIILLSLQIYFSPFYSCVRATGTGTEMMCALASAGTNPAN
jgi:hypothetical protein